MKVDVINEEFSITVYGFSGVAINNNYGETGSRLMKKMWEHVSANKIPNKGINIWVYETGGKLLTGVELEDMPPLGTGLELKKVNLEKYAYYKHVGPYHQLSKVYPELTAELDKKGLIKCFPWLEIYGHWNKDESKLETEILICLK